jgi:hypothetical protein
MTELNISNIATASETFTKPVQPVFTHQVFVSVNVIDENVHHLPEIAAAGHFKITASHYEITARHYEFKNRASLRGHYGQNQNGVHF